MRSFSTTTAALSLLGLLAGNVAAQVSTPAITAAPATSTETKIPCFLGCLPPSSFDSINCICYSTNATTPMAATTSEEVKSGCALGCPSTLSLDAVNCNCVPTAGGSMPSVKSNGTMHVSTPMPTFTGAAVAPMVQGGVVAAAAGAAAVAALAL